MSFWSRFVRRRREAEAEPDPLRPPEVAPQPLSEGAVEAHPRPEPEAVPEPEVEPRAEPEPEPEAVAEPEAEVEPAPAGPEGGERAPLTAAEVEERLGKVLDSLGSAHRRPFARAG